MKLFNVLAVVAFVSLSGSAVFANHGTCAVNGKDDAKITTEEACKAAKGTWTPAKHETKKDEKAPAHK